MKSKFFAVRIHKVDLDSILLVIRIVMGAAFMIHGWGKIQNPLHWMGAEALVPGILQALAAISEFGGGLSLILGLLTRLGGMGLTCTMIVAVIIHAFTLGDPFVNAKGGSSYELAAVYLTLALLFAIDGPGKFSIDHKVFGVKS